MGIGNTMDRGEGWLGSDGYWHFSIALPREGALPWVEDGHLTETEEELAEWLAPENYWRWLKYQVGRGKIGGPWDGEVKYL